MDIGAQTRKSTARDESEFVLLAVYCIYLQHIIQKRYHTHRELLSKGRFCLATSLPNKFYGGVLNPMKAAFTQDTVIPAVHQVKAEG